MVYLGLPRREQAFKRIVPLALMITKEILQLLVCPESHQPLKLGEQKLIENLIQGIRAKKVKNRQGTLVEREPEQVLVREDRKYLYPIYDNIPVLLVEEAIPLELSEFSGV